MTPDVTRVDGRPRVMAAGRADGIFWIYDPIHFENEYCSEYPPCTPADPSSPAVMEFIKKEGEE